MEQNIIIFVVVLICFLLGVLSWLLWRNHALCTNSRDDRVRKNLNEIPTKKNVQIENFKSKRGAEHAHICRQGVEDYENCIHKLYVEIFNCETFVNTEGNLEITKRPNSNSWKIVGKKDTYDWPQEWQQYLFWCSQPKSLEFIIEILLLKYHNYSIILWINENHNKILPGIFQANFTVKEKGDGILFCIDKDGCYKWKKNELVEIEIFELNLECQYLRSIIMDEEPDLFESNDSSGTEVDDEINFCLNLPDETFE